MLNYAYMGSYSENPSIAYGMISPELVQLFGDNDERMNLHREPDWDCLFVKPSLRLAGER